MQVPKLVNQINKLLGESDLYPPGFINACTNKDGDFCLRIGARDIQLGEKGNFIGCGTDLELLEKFKILKNNS